MSIYAINHSPTVEDPHYTDHVRYAIRHEFVGGLLVPALDAVLEIPPRELHEWHLIHLCANTPDPHRAWLAYEPWLEVTKKGAGPGALHSRVIGAWCTQYDATALAYQIQTDRVVQFHADYPYDDDWEHPRSTDGVFSFRAARGCYPPGYAAAVYLRLECERATGRGDLQGLGIAQINVMAGPHMQEGGTHDGSMCFREQVKGLTRVDQTEAYGVVRLPIPPGSLEGLLCLQVSAWARGTYTASGFELLPS